MDKQGLKVDIATVKRGTKNSTRRLARWINQEDRDLLKRRLLITASVPTGLLVVGSAEPVIAISAGIIGSLTAVFWHARIEGGEIRLVSTDFLGPFMTHGYVTDFDGLLSTIVKRQKYLTPAQIRDLIHDEYGGPYMTEKAIESHIARLNLNPSPAPKAAPVKTETPDQDPSREDGQKQGRVKAELDEVSLPNAERSYTGQPEHTQKEQVSEANVGRSEEQDHDGDRPQVRSRDRREGHGNQQKDTPDADGPPFLHDGQEPAGDRDGCLPNPLRRDAEVPA